MSGEQTIYEAKHIILATGARSRVLPAIPQDGKRIIGYREALTLDHRPASLLVVGSGAIGSELAWFYNAMGTKVTLVEFMPTILPVEDEEVSKQVGRSFKKAGIEVLVKSTVESFDTQFFQPDVFNIGSDTDSRQYHFSFVGLDLIFLIPDIDFQ